MFSFNDYSKYKQLDERLIVINNNQNYGQIIFMLGGSGSGKGFVIKNFIDSNKFKVIDVDKWKESFIKLGQFKEKYKQFRNIDLRNPEDVRALHMFVKEKDIKGSYLKNIFRNAEALGSGNKETLPNVIFDSTGQRVSEITKILPLLFDAGYSPFNIHIIWVLTDYRVAIENNKNRARVVPEDILLQSHKAVAKNMYEFIKDNTPEGVKGSIYVVLNNKENTVFYNDPKGEGKKTNVIKDFKYFTVRHKQKNIIPKKVWDEQLFDWFKRNVPKEVLTDLGL